MRLTDLDGSTQQLSDSFWVVKRIVRVQKVFFSHFVNDNVYCQVSSLSLSTSSWRVVIYIFGVARSELCQVWDVCTECVYMKFEIYKCTFSTVFNIHIRLAELSYFAIYFLISSSL